MHPETVKTTHMGAGFVWIFWFFIFMIAAAVPSFICWLVAYLIVRNKQFEGKSQFLILVALTPVIIVFLELVIALFGSAIVSERHNVSLEFGDYWKAPLNEYYNVEAIDTPERTFIFMNYHDNDGIAFSDQISDVWVEHIWPTPDSTIVAGSQELDSHIFYSIFTFRPHVSTIDTIIADRDYSAYERALSTHNLQLDEALTPDQYYAKAQREAHKIERPIRHAIVLILTFFIWYAFIRGRKRYAL